MSLSLTRSVNCFWASVKDARNKNGIAIFQPFCDIFISPVWDPSGSDITSALSPALKCLIFFPSISLKPVLTGKAKEKAPQSCSQTRVSSTAEIPSATLTDSILPANYAASCVVISWLFTRTRPLSVIMPDVRIWIIRTIAATESTVK